MSQSCGSQPRQMTKIVLASNLSLTCCGATTEQECSDPIITTPPHLLHHPNGIRLCWKPQSTSSTLHRTSHGDQREFMRMIDSGPRMVGRRGRDIIEYPAMRNHAIAWIYQISARVSELKCWERYGLYFVE